MSDFADYFNALSETDFEERPVDIETFIYDQHYLGQPKLSEHQLTMARAMTQIYKRSTLVDLYGERNGNAMYDATVKEIILYLGKGSGKDYVSTIAVAYIVYLLLCLKDPASYYGKPPGDAIDIINIAINADQARNVFFKGFKNKIERSPWFQGKYVSKVNNIEFDKTITVHSGHSEKESWEGYNVLVVILDEISGFALESNAGGQSGNTSEELYKMYLGSVTSRFPDHGKLIMLSFSRYRGDFIQTKYEDAIVEKETVMRRERVMLNPELGDIEGNSIEIEWEEDYIISYKQSKVYALRRPSWDVNPTRKIEEYISDFYNDYEDAAMRFACMPPDSADGFFKSREDIENAFSEIELAVDEYGSFAEWFSPDPEKEYYIHVDLAQKVDRCVVAMSHVEKWVEVKYSNTYKRHSPYVVVDAVRYWKPTKMKTVEFGEVKDYIMDLYRRGFNIKLVTFDRWNSTGLINELKAYGVNAELLSVAKAHYTDLKYVIGEHRLRGPSIELLMKELLQLRVVKDKIDHPRDGSKDLADAVCGAVFNAVAHTPPQTGLTEVKVLTYDPVSKRSNKKTKPKQKNPGAMPSDLQQYLDAMRVI